MHVHVHARRVDLDVQHIHRLALAVQHVFIGAAGGVGDDLVAHKAAVDITKLLVGAGAGGIGNTGAAPDLDQRRRVACACRVAAGKINPHRALDKVAAQHVGQALLQGGQAVFVAAAPPLLDQLALMPDGKTHIRARQGMAAHRFHTMRQLGGIGLEKLAPCRGRKEQLFDLDCGAYRARHGFEFARLTFQKISMILAVSP